MAFARRVTWYACLLAPGARRPGRAFPREARPIGTSERVTPSPPFAAILRRQRRTLRQLGLMTDRSSAAATTSGPGAPSSWGSGVAAGTLERLIVDSFVAWRERGERAGGPVGHLRRISDLQFNLTGGKSWHRLAPFIGAGSRTGLGGRHAGRHQRVRLRHRSSTWHRRRGPILPHRPDPPPGEARVIFWKLNYPPASREPDGEPSPVIDDGLVSHQLVAQAGLRLLPVARCRSSLTRRWASAPCTGSTAPTGPRPATARRSAR